MQRTTPFAFIVYDVVLLLWASERDGAWSSLLSIWQRWDALWYQHIALYGYRPGDGTVAFYPLYPLLARAVEGVLGDNIVLAELLVSVVAFLVAMSLLYRVAALDVVPSTARLTVLLTAAFPVGFFFFSPYTEALFLALTVATFWFSRSKRPWLAGLAGFAAALARAQGALLVLPLAYNSVCDRRSEGKRPGLDLLASALPALGFLAVAGYDRLAVGDTHIGLSALALWGYRFAPPWTALSASWAQITGRGDLIEALNLICLLGFGVLAVIAAERLPFGYGLFLWPYLAPLFTREMAVSPLASVSRYTLVLFPCFIILASWLAPRPKLAAAWLAASLLLQLFLWQYWVHFGFVA